MKAITIKPKQKGALSLREVEKPECAENQVLVRVLDAGVCRTDLEIYEGLYGDAPEGLDYLIIGHECLGAVEETNTPLFRPGELVTRTVRRPCTQNCLNCASDENDMCLTGDYVETGIKGLHGDMAEYFAESQGYLVKLPEKLRDVGVLMEPMSVVEKALRQSFKVQRRYRWEPRRALVYGAGPIGLLSAMCLRLKGLETYVCAWSRPGNLKSEIAEKIGAKYASAQEDTLEGKFDLIIEASGSSDRIKDAFGYLATNGVLCLTSITGNKGTVPFPLEEINLDIVLGNKTIVGIVNANIIDYMQGIIDFAHFEQYWPGLTEKLITRRLKPEQYLEAFVKEQGDIKTVIEFSY